MGIFDKKICDICGKEIGLLGNRKLADGNCCKECASKLSPYFYERKQSTVAEIKQQLIYREQNQKNLENFKATVGVGHYKKVWLDEPNRRFIVTSSNDFKKANPDIINFDMVRQLNINVDEDRDEVYDKDVEGNSVSFNPPKYEYEYSFDVEFVLNHPYIEKITLELSDGNRPTSPESAEYKEYERQANVLTRAILNTAFINNLKPTYEEYVPEEVLPEGSWKCECGTINTSKFCTECGKEKPSNTPKFCPDCGTALNGAKFCPECGKKIV